MNQLNQKDSISKRIQKGNYGYQKNYRKIPKSIIEISLDLEKKLSDLGYGLRPTDFDSYVGYQVYKKRQNPKKSFVGTNDVNNHTHYLVFQFWIKSKSGRGNPYFVFKDDRILSPHNSIYSNRELYSVEDLINLIEEDYGISPWDFLTHKNINSGLNSTDNGSRTIYFYEDKEITSKDLKEIVL